ncbi:helix-turn-helix domain-containing protein [Streptomyces sp. NBC_01411]|uniref:helix-turn-helix domain-containing protein n=1 Tax=Streptomyces sp. NBC_01411 TaxID=2903857 RepID=UPI00386D7731
MSSAFTSAAASAAEAVIPATESASQPLADAALELFAERGYGNTTVLDIAKRAGLAKSSP